MTRRIFSFFYLFFIKFYVNLRKKACVSFNFSLLFSRTTDYVSTCVMCLYIEKVIVITKSFTDINLISCCAIPGALLKSFILKATVKMKFLITRYIKCSRFNLSICNGWCDDGVFRLILVVYCDATL